MTNQAMVRQDRQAANLARVNQDVEITYWDREQLAVIKRNFAVGLSDAELAYFAEICRATGLNPIQKQIYAYKVRSRDEQRLIIQTGIDGYRLIAERTGQYEGQTAPQWCGEDGEWRDVWLSDSPPAAARVGVWRKGFREPLYAAVTWAEFGGGSNDNWKKRPAHMLAKTAESHALRRAFPNETAGLEMAPDPDQAGYGAPPAVVIDAATRATDLYPPDHDGWPDEPTAPEQAARQATRITTEQMRRLHAIGKERGFEHPALSAWARSAYGVTSVRELSYEQAEDFIAAVESSQAANK